MNDESNALRYMQDGGEMVPLHRDSYGSGVQEWVKVEQIESLTREKAVFRIRWEDANALYKELETERDTLRAELDAAKVEIEYLVTRISYGHEPRQNPVRDEAICALNSLGMTPARIGIAFDVSRQRVHQIIDTTRSRGETEETK